jgi:hypothetical protein
MAIFQEHFFVKNIDGFSSELYGLCSAIVHVVQSSKNFPSIQCLSQDVGSFFDVC